MFRYVLTESECKQRRVYLMQVSEREMFDLTQDKIHTEDYQQQTQVK